MSIVSVYYVLCSVCWNLGVADGTGDVVAGTGDVGAGIGDVGAAWPNIPPSIGVVGAAEQSVGVAGDGERSTSSSAFSNIPRMSFFTASSTSPFASLMIFYCV